MSENANEQKVAVNQLIAEFMSRTDAGENLTAEQFIAEHPDQATALKQHFASVNLREGLKETGRAGHEETLVKPTSEGEISTGDPTANTILNGAADSETSVTRDHKQQNSGSATNIDIPETFGRYAIQKVLGQGAMGAVYLARDTQLDRDVALKIPKFGDGNGVDDQELLARFYREARASATIRSPNICPVYDVGDIGDQHYITMAYIEGRPLKDYTKSKKAHSEKQIITTIRKLALGLAEAHSIGVIHRDLKPANIMVDLKGEPVVMDFGLARRSDSDDVQVTQSGAILGTPAYMAPEQVAGDQAAIDHRVDIYALGVIMYELMTGEMPFKGNLMALLQQIALNNPKKPSEIRKDIDPRLEKICLKMMAGDQAKRYQSMQKVAADLQKVLRSPRKADENDSAKPTSPKLTSIPSAKDESNPALITIKESKSVSEQLQNKRQKSNNDKKQTSTSGSGSSKPPGKWVIGGGLAALLLIMGIVFTARVGKYEVQITLDDPTITLSVDGEVLNITDGQDVYKLTPGPHKLRLQKDGFETHVEEFTVTKDGKTVVHAVVVNDSLDGLINGEIPPVESNVATKNVPNSSANIAQTTGLLFDESLSHVEVHDLPIDLSQPFTFETWCRPLAFRTVNKGYSSQYVLQIGTYYLRLDNPKSAAPCFSFSTRDPDTTAYASVRSTIRPYIEQRMHLVGQWDGETFSLYVDGQKQTVQLTTWGSGVPAKPEWLTSVGRLNKNTDLIIGNFISQELGRPLPKNRYEFGGLIDQVRISSIARYDEDFNPEDMLDDVDTVALYKFDEGTGDVLKDASGNGHHGKIIGAKWVQVPAAPESEREIAEWILSKGGMVGLTPTSDADWVDTITTPADLPDGPLGILLVSISDIDRSGLERIAFINDLRHIYIYSSELSDDDLQPLERQTKLAVLLLNDVQGFDGHGLKYLNTPHLFGFQANESREFGDEGLRALSKHKQLGEIHASETSITDAGVEYLKDLTELESVGLGSPGVTDPGVEILHGLKKLKRVHLYSESTTQGAVDRLQKALPNCHITRAGRGGLQQDRPAGNGQAKLLHRPATDGELGSDRSVAEWLLSHGGKFRTNVTSDTYITDVSELPTENFRITRIQELSLRMDSNSANAAMQQLGSLTECEIMRITDSTFTDDGLAFVKHLPKLHELNLVRVPGVSGRGLANLPNPDAFHNLALHGTNIDDLGSKEISHFQKLRFLDLNHSGINDEQLANLAGLTELDRLWLPSNPITDAGLKHLVGLTKLRDLQLQQTGVTAAGIAKLQEKLPN
ncbi:MAG TPA: hypothetical protein DD473_20865, partial [Planctomycetaceae bacterium]|nr:hypothetical protein [Planctomycetaceae bacterium]